MVYHLEKTQHVWIWTATVREWDWPMDFESIRMPVVLTSQSPKVMSLPKRAPEMDLQPVKPALACGAWWWKRLPSCPTVIPSSVQERHLLRAMNPKKEGESHLSPVKSPLNSLPKETLRRPQTSNKLEGSQKENSQSPFSSPYLIPLEPVCLSLCPHFDPLGGTSLPWSFHLCSEIITE